MNGRKIINAKSVFAVCFFALMVAMGATAVVFYTKNILMGKQVGPVIEPDVPAVRSFNARYPFPKEKHSGASPFLLRMQNLFSKATAVYGRERTIQWILSLRTPLSSPFFHIPGTIDEISGSKVKTNGTTMIVQLPNGHFTYLFQPEDSAESWGMIEDFSVWLKKQGIPLFLLLPATKMDDSITVFPVRIPYSYAHMMVRYKAFLAEKQIPFLDAKDVLLAENEDFYFWFYKTDHHWNVFAGRLMAEAIARKLNDEFHVATDVRAIQKENLTLVKYPSSMRGSMNAGGWIHPEDFEVFYQRKESFFHLMIPGIGIDREGGFNDTLIAQPHLKASNPYCAFLYGGQALVRVENRSCINGTRVLVIKQSLAEVLCPYLACTVQYLDAIDLRFFDGCIRTFIEETRPDVVLICI